MTAAIATQSSQVAVSTGIPQQASFSLAVACHNVEAWSLDGQQAAVIARLSDRFNSPVPDGTAVSLFTEGGQVAAQCTTTTVRGNSGCTANWVSQAPRPPQDPGKPFCTLSAIAGASYTGRMDESLPTTAASAAPPRPSIFLVGPMGSGKSAVGKVLARLLGFRFIDSDAEIERRTGVDIPFIFEKEGEPGFRVREREVVDDLTRLPGIVLATGGGAVLSPENRSNLAARGIVVYLEASVGQQVERTKHGRHRPLLNDTDPEARLTELMSVRGPLYRSIAHVTVSTDRRKVQAVAEHIIAGIEALAPPAAPPAG